MQCSDNLLSGRTSRCHSAFSVQWCDWPNFMIIPGTCKLDPWQFAVEIESLVAVGITVADLNWLVQGRYAEHARESNPAWGCLAPFRPAAKSTTISFLGLCDGVASNGLAEPLKTLEFPRRSCFRPDRNEDWGLRVPRLRGRFSEGRLN